MAIVKLPRNMVRACKLFLQRDYDEAFKIMERVSGVDHQKEAILAQLALFSNDYSGAAEYCMSFIPHLDEWYTINMINCSFAMLTFCAFQTDRQNVLNFLENLKRIFIKRESNQFTNIMIGSIDKSVEALMKDTFEKKYIPPENPMSLIEAIAYLKEKCHKDLTGETPDDAAYILSRMDRKMDALEYIKYYERFADSVKLTEYTRFDAIKIYSYLDKPDKIREAVCDFYKYSWIPVEKTMVMPISIFTYDINIWSAFSKELFDYIYKNVNVYFEPK